MLGRITRTPGVPFHSPGTLTAHHVGVGPSLSGRLYRFMHIKHDSVLGGLFQHPQIMPHHILAVMVVSSGYSSGVSRLYGVYSVRLRPCESGIELAFVVGDVTARFMMKDI